MNELPRDIIIYMAMTMDLPEILSLCQSSTRLNEILCENQHFWRKKLVSDYNIHANNRNPKEYYRFISTQNPNELLIHGADESNMDWVRVSLTRGANIHHERDLAVITASKNGNLNIVRYLVERGANIRAQGDSAIYLASMYGHDEIVQYLLGLGAEIFQENGVL